MIETLYIANNQVSSSFLTIFSLFCLLRYFILALIHISFMNHEDDSIFKHFTVHEPFQWVIWDCGVYFYFYLFLSLVESNSLAMVFFLTANLCQRRGLVTRPLPLSKHSRCLVELHLGNVSHDFPVLPAALFLHYV